MKKNSKKLISKGWMRIHIILCLIPTPIILLYAGFSDWFREYDGATMEWKNNVIEFPIELEEAYGLSICSFLLYWIVLGLIVWIKKGFKE